MIWGGEDNFDGYFGGGIEVVILMREGELFGYLLRLERAEMIVLVFELWEELRRRKEETKKDAPACFSRRTRGNNPLAKRWSKPL